jgi:Leucine-rich repeat (LRR) protein
LAEKTIKCEVKDRDCKFSGVTIGADEKVSIKTDPEDTDVETITKVQFSGSSIHSIPAELFEKFPNLQWLSANEQGIREIKANTFKNAKKLETIDLARNSLSTLDVDTFRGNFRKSGNPSFYIYVSCLIR